MKNLLSRIIHNSYDIEDISDDFKFILRHVCEFLMLAKSDVTPGKSCCIMFQCENSNYHLKINNINYNYEIWISDVDDDMVPIYDDSYHINIGDTYKLIRLIQNINDLILDKHIQ